MPEQLGLVGFFYPTQAPLTTGAFASAYPALVNPVITLDVYEGDLGIDDGTPRSVYTLDTGEMTQLTGRAIDVASIELAPGETADLPDGLGSITFENEAPAGAEGYEQSVKRFVSLSIHRDAAATWVLVFAVTALLGTAGRAVRAATAPLGQGHGRIRPAPAGVRRPGPRRGPGDRRRARPVRAPPSGGARAAAARADRVAAEPDRDAGLARFAAA